MSLRSNYIGLWLSAAPEADQIWNNQVVVTNSNFEWNGIGIAIDAGDDVLISGNDIEGHGGPGIVAAGVWGLTVFGNYYEANNNQHPTYQVGQYAMPIVGDVILTGAGSRLPWNAALDAPWDKSRCKVKDGKVVPNDPAGCTMPRLACGGIQCEGVTVQGNAFSYRSPKTAPPQCKSDPKSCEYSAVVATCARGVVVSGNELNGAGSLFLGPAGSGALAKEWLAEDVHYFGNARFAPSVRMAPSMTTGSSGATAVPMAKARQIGCPTCVSTGYSSWHSPAVLHRNLCDPTLTDKGCVGVSKPVTGQTLDGRQIFSAASGQLTEVPLASVPSLSGHAVYASIRVKPAQNGTSIALGIGPTQAAAMNVNASSSCGGVAGQWGWCIVASAHCQMTMAGSLGVWLDLSGGSWELADVALAPVGASWSTLSV